MKTLRLSFLYRKKINFFSESRLATFEDNVQYVYDYHRKALLGSVLSRPAAEWFNSLETTQTWNETKTQFLAQFTDGNLLCRFRVEAENLKIQPNENIASNIHKIKTLVDKGWPTPSDADADAQTACRNQRLGKWENFLIHSLTAPGLKHKAHQALIEDPKKTWDALQLLIINRDTSLVICAETSGSQQPSSPTSADSTDSRFTNIEKTLNEVSNKVKNHQINAGYDLKTPNRNKILLDFAQFAINPATQKKFVRQWKKRNPIEEKASPQPKENYSQNHLNWPNLPNKCRSNSNDRSTSQICRCEPQS